MNQVIGIVDGAPSMHYFDVRGVHRTFTVAITGDTWRYWNDTAGLQIGPDPSLIAIYTFQLAAGMGSSDGGGSDRTVAQVLQYPGGRIAIAIAGAGLAMLMHSYSLMVGLWQLIHPNKRFGRAMGGTALRALNTYSDRLHDAEARRTEMSTPR